ncbi:MAG: DUF956 family protein [Anaerostipes sp.]|nr:DUF956 family protein [Anaerostipes sp.]
MAQSINTKVDYVIDGTSYHGLTTYGKIMIGDKGFEFFNDRNVEDFIQIPWEEVDYVLASVMFGGKHIPRYALRTKKNGDFSFSSKKPIEVLRAISKYVAADHMVRSLSFFQVLKRKVTGVFKKDK